MLRPALLLAALLAAGCAAPLGTPPAGQEPSAATVPDPLATGPHSVARLEYDFGLYVVDDSSLAVYHYAVPLHGSLHLPDGDGAAPVVVLLHGRHGTCVYAGQVQSLAAACPDAPPVADPIDSYTGYDGLAQNLASWGYAVASIDANTINDRDLAGDAGANARAAVVLRTLDELASVNATGHGLGSIGGLPASVPASPPERDVSAARGRLDLSRVGLMGHSRGGEGVARAVGLDQERNGGAHGLDAVFALAPTDFARWPVPGVAFATLLPYCDGDVSNLQGAAMYDDARRLEPGAPRHQVLAMGANHNFYNTVWTGDDWGTRPDPWCNADAKGNGRDTPEQQRAHGDGLMASFFRLYVGGEQAFAPLWDGTAPWPASMCPGRASCDGRLYASHMPLRRQDLAIDGMPAVQQGLKPARCEGAGCPSQPGYSKAQQAVWDCHGGGAATFTVPGGLGGWKALSMRVANRPPGGNPLHVTVAGLPAALPVLASDPGPGELAFPPRPGDPETEPGAKTVLSEVRFPFPDGSDLAGVTSLQVRCDGDGGIQVADVMLV